jgi:hypothetical protein
MITLSEITSVCFAPGRVVRLWVIDPADVTGEPVLYQGKWHGDITAAAIHSLRYSQDTASMQVRNMTDMPGLTYRTEVSCFVSGGDPALDALFTRTSNVRVHVIVEDGSGQRLLIMYCRVRADYEHPDTLGKPTGYQVTFTHRGTMMPPIYTGQI